MEVQQQEQIASAVDLDLTTSVKRVLKAASYRDALAKGLHEVCKAIDISEEAKKPVCAFLSENCDEKQYKKLVQSLSKEKNIPLIIVKDRELLGEWVGLCRYDATMTPKKIRKCSSVVLREFVILDDAANVLQKALSDAQANGQAEIKLP